MNFRTLLAGAALVASALTAQADPVLVMQAVGGVDLQSLIVGQKFQVEIVIHGDTPGEVDKNSGNGDLFGATPFLSATADFGTVHQGIDWTLDPSLFIIDFTALQAGSGTLTTANTCLISSINSSIKDYGCNFSSGPLNFTVRSLPEPASLAMVGLALLGLGAIRRRAA